MTRLRLNESALNARANSILLERSDSARNLYHHGVIHLCFAVILCTIVFSDNRLFAQDSAPSEVSITNRTGDVPYSAQIGTQFEHVELSSGNLIVTIPFLHLPGRRMSFDYGIRYDAAYWLLINTPGVSQYWNVEMRNWLTASTLGWTSTQPYSTSTTATMAGGTGCQGSGTRQDSEIFTDSEGTKHVFPINYQSGSCQDVGFSFYNQQGPSINQDGFWGTGYGNSTVIGPDGTQYSAGGTSGGSSTTTNVFADMATMTDTRGNTQVVSPGHTDTVGRTPITESTNGNQMVYTVYDSSGNQQKYTVNLESIAVSTHFDYTYAQVSEYNATRTTVASVVLPNGQSYGFTYDSYGDITEITLPTGGYVSYVWENTPDGSLRHVASRTVNDGNTSSTWTMAYTYSQSSSNYTVTLTSPADPQGTVHNTVYSFSYLDGITPQITGIVYDPQSNGSFVKGYSMTYYQSPSFPPYPEFTGTALLKSITTTLNAGSGGSGGTVSQKQYDYDVFAFERYDVDCSKNLEACAGQTFTPEFDAISAGDVTAIREYSAGTGAPGALVRQTIRTYLQDTTSGYGMTPAGLNPLKRVKYTGVNIVDRVVDEVVYDGSVTCTGTGSINSSTGAYVPPPACSANKISEKTAQYDNQSPSSYGYHGEETAYSTWLNTSASYLMTTYVHDSFGNLTSITDPKTNQTQIGYSDLYASGVSTCSIASNSSVYPTSIIDPLGHTHKFTYYACTGKTQAEQNPNDIAAGRVGTTWKYDAMGRVTSEIYPDTGQTTITYNDSYPDSVTTSDLVTSNSSEVTTVQKDGLGRQVKTTLSSDPEGAVYTLTTYDNLGRVYQKTNPYRSTSDPTYGVTSTLYDALARPLTITNPDNTTLQWQYSGLAVTNTDEAGNQWTRTSDALGRLVQVLEPNGTTQTPTMETDYTYDLQNNLLTVTQWGGPSGSPNPQRRSYAYDSFSRLLGANNPEHRNSSDAATQTCAGAPSGTTWTTCYSYDSDSNLYTTTDNRGLMITYTVDKKNRVTQKTYSNGDATVNFTYDAYSSTNNGIDLRTGMSDASGSTNWTYDPMGRVWSESKTISGINKLVSTLYNLDGSTWKVTYPSGAVIEYTQSTAGRTLKVNDDTNNIPYAQNALYAPQGGLTSLLVGATSSYLGTTITNQYNDRLQPLVISADSPAATLLSLTYNFHLGSGDNGNVFGITNNKATTRSESFQYDTLNRLVSAQTTGTQWGVTFTYDPFGNLYQTAGISGQQVLPMSVNQYADPNSNHFTLLGYQYDAAGDVLSDGINSGCGGSAFAWNTEAEMTCGAGVNYTYDGDGARVKKSSGTIYWGGSEGGALAESDLSGNLTSEYVFLNGKRLARRDISSNKVYYYFSDMLGSASVVTDNAGNIENESDFYPFGGESVVTQNLANQHYKFTGKERDTESGNDYFGARYYSSTVGRFLSPDWSGKVEPVPYAKLDNPQSLNLYAYVMNRPVSDSDPDGHCGASGCAVPGYFGGAALRVLPTQDNSYGGDGTAWDPDSDVQAIMAQAAAQQTQLTASTLGKLGLSKSLHVTADQVAAAVLGQEFRGEGTEAAAAGAVVLLNRMIEVESGDANWGQAGGVSQKNLSKNDNLMLELISTPGQFTALSGNPGHISSILSGKSDSPEYSAALGKLRSVNIGSESLGGFRTVGSHDMGTRDQFRSNWSGEPRHGGILINHTEFF